jgi:ATP-dependent RNA helicase DHX37/DHR1
VTHADTFLQRKIIRQILTAGFIDQVAVLESITLKKGAAAHSSTRGIPYRAIGIPEPVFIHPSSALFHSAPPEYLVFTEVVRTTRPYLKGITKIQPAWLAVLGKDMCTFSRPVDPPGAASKARLNPAGNEREVIVVPHFGDLGIDLPPVKRKQRREGTRWVMME